MTTRVSYNLKDALLIRATAYPTAAGTVNSEALDLHCIGDRGVRIDPFELLIAAPEATAAQLPNGATNTFTLQFSDNTDFTGTVKEVSTGTVWRQVGSASGAEAVEIRYRVATDEPRYVRARCVTAGSAAQTGKTFEFAIVT